MCCSNSSTNCKSYYKDKATIIDRTLNRSDNSKNETGIHRKAINWTKTSAMRSILHSNLKQQTAS